MPNHAPGPELDLEMAKLLDMMPEKRCHDELIQFPPGCRRKPDCEGCPNWYADEPDDYSTDIAAAWEIVEKLRLWVYPSDDSDGWEAGLPDDDSCWKGADTAPMAICLAALESKGE